MGVANAGQRMMTDRLLIDRQETDGPVTLHRIMQTMIGQGLREHYQAPQKLSHELFVLLMQLNEQERKSKSTARRPRTSDTGRF
jgi:hypothetical protein